MKTLTDEDKVDILAKMDCEGFDYYLENYAKDDFAGTILEPELKEFLAARKKLSDALVKAGIDIDSY